MCHPTDLRQDIYTESGAPIKRIQIDISQDNSDLETNNRNVCEYFDCFNKAILTIEVQVGVLGIITLFLCQNCLSKFQDDRNDTTR